MKINRKLKTIFSVAGTLSAVALITLPAVTLTSCSAASNAYYPTTKISIQPGLSGGNTTLGLAIPTDYFASNGGPGT